MKGAWREIMNGFTTLYYYRFTKGAWREMTWLKSQQKKSETQVIVVQLHDIYR